MQDSFTLIDKTHRKCYFLSLNNSNTKSSSSVQQSVRHVLQNSPEIPTFLCCSHDGGGININLQVVVPPVVQCTTTQDSFTLIDMRRKAVYFFNDDAKSSIERSVILAMQNDPDIPSATLHHINGQHSININLTVTVTNQEVAPVSLISSEPHSTMASCECSHEDPPVEQHEKSVALVPQVSIGCQEHLRHALSGTKQTNQTFGNKEIEEKFQPTKEAGKGKNPLQIFLKRDASSSIETSSTTNEQKRIRSCSPASSGKKAIESETSTSAETTTKTLPECGERDIVLDDPTHPGTIFFNGVIDSLKDLYDNASAENEESITQLVAQRFDEFKKRYDQEKKSVPKEESRESMQLSNTNISDSGAKELIEALEVKKKTSHETNLDIGNISNSNAKESAHVLKVYSTLQSSLTPEDDDVIFSNNGKSLTTGTRLYRELIAVLKDQYCASKSEKHIFSNGLYCHLVKDHDRRFMRKMSDSAWTVMTEDDVKKKIHQALSDEMKSAKCNSTLAYNWNSASCEEKEDIVRKLIHSAERNTTSD